MGHLNLFRWLGQTLARWIDTRCGPMSGRVRVPDDHGLIAHAPRSERGER